MTTTNTTNNATRAKKTSKPATIPADMVYKTPYSSKIEKRLEKSGNKMPNMMVSLKKVYNLLYPSNLIDGMQSEYKRQIQLALYAFSLIDADVELEKVNNAETKAKEKDGFSDMPKTVQTAVLKQFDESRNAIMADVELVASYTDTGNIVFDKCVTLLDKASAIFATIDEFVAIHVAWSAVGTKGRVISSGDHEKRFVINFNGQDELLNALYKYGKRAQDTAAQDDECRLAIKKAFCEYYDKLQNSKLVKYRKPTINNSAMLKLVTAWFDSINIHNASGEYKEREKDSYKVLKESDCIWCKYVLKITALDEDEVEEKTITL